MRRCNSSALPNCGEVRVPPDCRHSPCGGGPCTLLACPETPCLLLAAVQMRAWWCLAARPCPTAGSTTCGSSISAPASGCSSAHPPSAADGVPGRFEGLAAAWTDITTAQLPYGERVPALELKLNLAACPLELRRQLMYSRVKLWLLLDIDEISGS